MSSTGLLVTTPPNIWRFVSMLQLGTLFSEALLLISVLLIWTGEVVAMINLEKRDNGDKSPGKGLVGPLKQPFHSM